MWASGLDGIGPETFYFGGGVGLGFLFCFNWIGSVKEVFWVGLWVINKETGLRAWLFTDGLGLVINEEERT